MYVQDVCVFKPEVYGEKVHIMSTLKNCTVMRTAGLPQKPR